MNHKPKPPNQMKRSMTLLVVLWFLKQATGFNHQLLSLDHCPLVTIYMPVATQPNQTHTSYFQNTLYGHYWTENTLFGHYHWIDERKRSVTLLLVLWFLKPPARFLKHFMATTSPVVLDRREEAKCNTGALVFETTCPPSISPSICLIALR